MPDSTRDATFPGVPAVSVCIPVYQGAAHIGRAIRSVLDQSFTDFELVVRDNGCTDGTSEIVRSFDDPRIRIERAEKTVSMVDNWNGAVGLCRAPLVKVLCADDVLRPDCLELQVGAMRQDPSLAVVAGRIDMIDGHDRVLFADRHLAGLIGTFDLDTVVRRVVRNGGNPIGESAAILFRRADFHEVGGFDGSELFTMDLDMWVRLLACGRFRGMRETVAGFRIHGGSASAAASRREFETQRRCTRGLIEAVGPSAVRRRDVVVGYGGAYAALARRMVLFVVAQQTERRRRVTPEPSPIRNETVDAERA